MFDKSEVFQDQLFSGLYYRHILEVPLIESHGMKQSVTYAFQRRKSPEGIVNLLLILADWIPFRTRPISIMDCPLVFIRMPRHASPKNIPTRSVLFQTDRDGTGNLRNHRHSNKSLQQDRRTQHAYKTDRLIPHDGGIIPSILINLKAQERTQYAYNLYSPNQSR